MISGESCSLCVGGEAPNGGLKFSDIDMTCSEVEDMIADLDIAQDDHNCHVYQAEGYLHCGCTAYPTFDKSPNCTLCAGDREPNHSNATAYVGNSRNATCGDFKRIAPYLFQEFNCFLLDEARETCGCPEAPTCSLCVNGEAAVDPNKLVTGATGDLVSCQRLHEAAGFLEAGVDLDVFLNTCRSVQVEYSPKCCPESGVAIASSFEVAPLSPMNPAPPPAREPTTPSIGLSSAKSSLNDLPVITILLLIWATAIIT